MFINELQIIKKFRNKSVNFRMITNIINVTVKESLTKIYALRQFNNKRVERIHNKLGFKIVSLINECDLFLKTDYMSFVSCLKQTIKKMDQKK